MEAVEVVDVKESTGSKRTKPKMAFDELWAWEIDNPGKTPPKIDKEFIDGWSLITNG